MVRAEPTKRLDVKRPGIRARGDTIGIPLPNILDWWASHTGRCESATAEKAVPCPSDCPSIPALFSLRCAQPTPAFGCCGSAMVANNLEHAGRRVCCSRRKEGDPFNPPGSSCVHQRKRNLGADTTSVRREA